MGPRQLRSPAEPSITRIGHAAIGMGRGGPVEALNRGAFIAEHAGYRRHARSGEDAP